MATKLPKAPAWDKHSTSDWPHYDGFPRQYRVNQETGAFMLGSVDLGAELVVQVFGYHWETGQMGKGVERWGFGQQVWLDLAFVDENGFASILSLKKDSATNMHVRLQDLERRGSKDSPMCYAMRLGLEEIEAHDGTYYVVQVEEVLLRSERDYQRLKAFRDSEVFQIHLIGETTKGPLDDFIVSRMQTPRGFDTERASDEEEEDGSDY